MRGLAAVPQERNGARAYSTAVAHDRRALHVRGLAALEQPLRRRQA